MFAQPVQITSTLFAQALVAGGVSAPNALVRAMVAVFTEPKLTAVDAGTALCAALPGSPPAPLEAAVFAAFPNMPGDVIMRRNLPNGGDRP